MMNSCDSEKCAVLCKCLSKYGWEIADILEDYKTDNEKNKGNCGSEREREKEVWQRTWDIKVRKRTAQEW